MFGFSDKDTPEVARRLRDRAKELDMRFLRGSFDQARVSVISDLAEKDRFIGNDEVTFRDPALPEFSCTIRQMLGLTMSIAGNGRFNGFILQSDAEDHSWFTNVYSPAARDLGPKAKKLQAVLEREFGVRNLNKAMAQFRR